MGAGTKRKLSSVAWWSAWWALPALSTYLYWPAVEMEKCRLLDIPSLDHCIISREATVPQSPLCLWGRNQRGSGRNMSLFEPAEELGNQFSYIKCWEPCAMGQPYNVTLLSAGHSHALRCDVVMVYKTMITNGRRNNRICHWNTE